jgi:hypothetical protein
MASAIETTESRAFYVAGQNIGTIIQTCIEFDDSSDVTIATPTSPECIFLLAFDYAVTSAHSLVFKSGTGIVKSLSFSGATSFVSGYVNTGLLFTGAGEALKASLTTPGYLTTFHTTSHELAAAFLRKSI